MRVAALVLACCTFAAEPLTNESIAKLTQSGVSEATIVETIRTSEVASFRLTPADTDWLLRQGVSETIIKAMAARASGQGGTSKSGEPASKSTTAANSAMNGQVPVEITHQKGSFSGQLSITATGPLYRAKTVWNATIRNTSPHRIFRATFCVKAFDTANEQIRPGGDECLLKLWGTDWASGVALNFKGKQDVKISQSKAPTEISKYSIEAAEVFDNSPNIRDLDVRCPLVWSSALRVFAERKFRPTVLDKESFTATYAYDGGRITGYSDAKQMLKSFTTANTALMGPRWESFRIDAASLYLREEKPGGCTAEVKMSFAGFGKPLLGQYSWYAVESNYNFEKAMMDELEAQSKKASTSDMDKAISQLPTDAPTPVESTVKPQLTITSEPSGAEIEIDGEFIGNTPTTIITKQGTVLVTVKKTGFQPWQRKLNLHAGDKRTLSVEMTK